jgi:hypothetical protein
MGLESAKGAPMGKCIRTLQVCEFHFGTCRHCAGVLWTRGEGGQARTVGVSPSGRGVVLVRFSVENNSCLYLSVFPMDHTQQRPLPFFNEAVSSPVVRYRVLPCFLHLFVRLMHLAPIVRGDKACNSPPSMICSHNQKPQAEVQQCMTSGIWAGPFMQRMSDNALDGGMNRGSDSAVRLTTE